MPEAPPGLMAPGGRGDARRLWGFCLESTLFVALVLAVVVLVASMLSVKLGISVAVIEIVLGVAIGNTLGLEAPEWLVFLATFGGVVLTFLAGAEVDPGLLRAKAKESLVIGGLSFLLPFAAVLLCARYLAGWDWRAAAIAAIALSSTSLAVVYAVLVETGLNVTEIGKLIMAATFVTGLGAVGTLSVLFTTPTWWLVPFVGVSALLIWVMPKLEPWFFARFGNRVTEPEIKGAFAALLVLMWLGERAGRQAVLPAFLLGLALARTFERHRAEQRRFRVVAFSLLTPLFFVRSGMNVSLDAVWGGLGLVALLLAAKLAFKGIAVYPVARRWVPEHATFTTLLLSTELTFGTIAATAGLNAGVIDSAQFSVLVAVVVLSAVVPTAIAQRWFTPTVTGTAGGLRRRPVGQE
jgi:Kef-type K+ transport system membrane component KefB